MRRVVVTASLVLLLASPATAQVEKSAEQLFPRETVAFLAIPNVNDLETRWNRTELGKLFADPALKPFREEIQRQWESRRGGLTSRFGLSPGELRSILSGELAVGTMAWGAEQVGTVLVCDVGTRLKEAQALLAKVADGFRKDGAKESTMTLAGQKVTVFTFPAEAKKPPRRPAMWIIVGKRLLVGDDNRSLEAVLTAIGQSQPGLAEDPAFQAVFSRCLADAGSAPQIRWFIRPLEYLEAIRAYTPPDRRRRDSIVARLRAAGFGSLRAMGGVWHVGEGDFQLMHRMMVYAPKPLEKSAKIFNLPNTRELLPAEWLPRDIAGITCVSCNIQEAFEHVGPVFDQFVGEGEEGVWEDVLDSLKNDPEGPQIDLRSELIAHLGQRALIITSYEEPIGPQSERLLFAIEVRNPERVAQALQKTLENDKEIEKRQFGDLVIWETVRKDTEPKRSVRLEMPTIPGRGSQPESEETEHAPLLPNAAITVAKGYLLIASHYEFLVRLLRPVEPRNTLVRSVDWMIVDEMIRSLGGSEECLRIFYRSDQMYRPTYELIRQGKMPESESILGRFLNTLLGPEEGGEIRKQKIDGSKLPDFEVVRRHLGLVGIFGREEENGWFIKGFMLSPTIAR
ncbi:MAG: DUF3352 domain-containing protein [Thermoguttaceae bacterium]|nr:DUF3352 domain-containing protein [Thermoguttaceae bacterium]MDW8079495.1 hypothetical protein [Thermoguttaceae bacterium]